MHTLLAALGTFATLVAMSLSTASAQVARGCSGGQHRLECAPEECSCDKWIIEWRNPDGTACGSVEGKTVAEVEARKDRSIAFERSYAKFFKKPFDPNYADPSEPQCVTCRMKRQFPKATRKLREAGLLAADDYERKLEESMRAFVRSSAHAPTRDAGRVLKGYLTALQHAFKTVSDLRTSLRLAEEGVVQTASLLALIEEMNQANQIAENGFLGLPPLQRESLRHAVALETCESKGRTAHFEEGRCMVCLPGADWDGTHCSCPEGTMLTGGECKTTQRQSRPFGTPLERGVICGAQEAPTPTIHDVPPSGSGQDSPDPSESSRPSSCSSGEVCAFEAR